MIPQQTVVAAAVFVEPPKSAKSYSSFRLMMMTAGIQVTVGNHTLMEGPLSAFTNDIARLMLPVNTGGNARVKAILFLLPHLRVPKLKLVLSTESTPSLAIEKFTVRRKAGMGWLFR